MSRSVARRRVALLLGAMWLLAGGCQLFMGEPRQQNKPLEPDLAPSAEEAPPSSATLALAPESQPSAEPTPSATVAPGVVQTPSEPTRGTLPKRAIAQVLDEADPDFAKCMEQGLRRKSGLRGNINLNFTIAPDGTVPYAAALEQGTDLPDEGVVECVLKVVQHLQFPEPRGGRVVVTHALRLGPAE